MKKGYDDYTDVAMASSDADGTEKAFITRIQADQVASAVDDGIGIVKLRKFWMACTDLMAADRRHKEAPLDPNLEAPIPEREAVDIGKKVGRQAPFRAARQSTAVSKPAGEDVARFSCGPTRGQRLVGEQAPPKIFLRLTVG